MRNWILAFSMVLGLPSAIAAAAAQDEAPKVRLVTSKGDIVIALRPDAAPQSVRNFLDYVEAGFYAGTIFHRVIDGFMIQGGGFAADYQRKPTRAPVPNEADNGLQNRRGSIAMARTFEPHSATAQFYINLQDNAFLDHRDKTPQGWGYAVFGQVVEGMDVVDAIGGVPTGPAGSFPKDAPREPIVIEKVERVGAADEDAAAAAKEE